MAPLLAPSYRCENEASEKSNNSSKSTHRVSCRFNSSLFDPRAHALSSRRIQPFHSTVWGQHMRNAARVSKARSNTISAAWTRRTNSTEPQGTTSNRSNNSSTRCLFHSSPRANLRSHLKTCCGPQPSSAEFVHPISILAWWDPWALVFILVEHFPSFWLPFLAPNSGSPHFWLYPFPHATWAGASMPLGSDLNIDLVGTGERGSACPAPPPPQALPCRKWDIHHQNSGRGHPFTSV